MNTINGNVPGRAIGERLARKVAAEAFAVKLCLRAGLSGREATDLVGRIRDQWHDRLADDAWKNLVEDAIASRQRT